MTIRDRTPIVLDGALANLTTIGLGGHATCHETATTADEVGAILNRAKESRLPLYVLGGGSNVVVADEGLRGVVLQLESADLGFSRQGEDVLVDADAGLNWDSVVQETTARNLQGLECLGGIPGKVGATPIQNVGAYGQEVGDAIDLVWAIDRSSGAAVTFDQEACGFGYRTSFFKKQGRDRYVVTRVRFRLHPDRPPTIRYGELSRAIEELDMPNNLDAVRQLVVQLRRKKSMVYDPADENHRSCGSFFVNAQLSEDQLETLSSRAGETPPSFPGDGGLVKIPSAWLIERAGLERGFRHGQVGLSTKHTLCLVAHPGATSRELIQFAWTVRRQVEDRFGVTLVPEPHFWGFDELDAGLPRLSSSPSGVSGP